MYLGAALLSVKYVAAAANKCLSIVALNVASAGQHSISSVTSQWLCALWT